MSKRSVSANALVDAQNVGPRLRPRKQDRPLRKTLAFGALLTLVFAGLKLALGSAVSWWLVTFPLWGPAAAIVAGGMVGFVVLLFVTWMD